MRAASARLENSPARSSSGCGLSRNSSTLVAVNVRRYDDSSENSLPFEGLVACGFLHFVQFAKGLQRARSCVEQKKKKTAKAKQQDHAQPAIRLVALGVRCVSSADRIGVAWRLDAHFYNKSCFLAPAQSHGLK